MEKNRENRARKKWKEEGLSVSFKKDNIWTKFEGDYEIISYNYVRHENSRQGSCEGKLTKERIFNTAKRQWG